MIVAATAPIGARIVDSYPFSIGGTREGAHALKAAGADGVALYIGVASPALAQACLLEGLGVFGVTVGDRFDGNAAVAAIRAWGMPVGTTHFLDVEGPSLMTMDPAALCARIDGWADPMDAAQFVAGLYLAPPQPLTSAEVYARPKIRRYWKGAGSIRDRFDALVEPACGWCLTQEWPSHTRGGITVDDDFEGEDFRGRSIVWAIAA